MSPPRPAARLAALLLLLAAGRARALFILHNKPEHAGKPYVVLVSIDGYRHDYTDKFKPKNLSRLRAEGSRAEGLIPVFPSKTFPNHYSIVTGLNPGRHGIVANKFYAPDLGEVFRLSDRDAVGDGRFYGGLPLWAAAARAGMVSAVYFWPGSEAEIAGYRPSRYLLYNASVPYAERVGQVLEWLRLPESQRPHLLLLYFDRVDKAGHLHGPSSKEVRSAVEEADEAIGRLREGLIETGLPVDLIVVSDHGMLDLDYDHPIYLDDKTDFEDARVIDYSQFWLIYAKDSAQRDKLAASLSENAAHYRVHPATRPPANLRLDPNSRLGDILLEADPPYVLSLRAKSEKLKGASRRAASHGYDPDLTADMRGIFYAHGPDIRPGETLPPFGNVHIYPFILRLLGLEIPEGIDGDPGVLAGLLEDGK